MSMKKPARQMQNVKFSEIAEKMETATGFLSGDELATDHADVATLKQDVATMKAGTFSSGLSVIGSVEATGSIKADVDLEAVGDVKAGDEIIANTAVSTPKLTTAGDTISAEKPVIEVMPGYSFTPNPSRSYKYVGICKNGNKLTCVIYSVFRFSSQIPALTAVDMGTFNIPSEVGAQLIPFTFADLSMLSGSKTAALTYIDTSLDIYQYIRKFSDTQLNVIFYSHNPIPADTAYLVRFEFTLLLSPNLAATNP